MFCNSPHTVLSTPSTSSMGMPAAKHECPWCHPWAGQPWNMNARGVIHGRAVREYECPWCRPMGPSSQPCSGLNAGHCARGLLSERQPPDVAFLASLSGGVATVVVFASESVATVLEDEAATPASTLAAATPASTLAECPWCHPWTCRPRNMNARGVIHGRAGRET